MPSATSPLPNASPFLLRACDVESLAQRCARYINVCTEEGEYLASDPTRRDRACSELYKNPKVKQEVSPDALVPFGGDTDPSDYLAWIDRELEKAPNTFEEYAMQTLSESFF